MGFWRRTFGLDLPTMVTEADQRARTFSVDVDSGVLYGTPTLDDWIYRRGGRVTRAEALRVPGVKRARDLICALGQFPLIVFDPAGKPAASTFAPNLFQQPEPGVAKSVTWSRVVEDMLFDQRAWLKTLAVGWHGYPIEARRLDNVTIQPKIVHYPEGSAEVWPDVPGMVRIDSPNPGLLSSPAILACIALDRATLNAVNGVPPMDYFTPTDENDPLDEDEVPALLDAWEEARRERSTAYVPASVKYNVAGWDPEKLQLKDVREFAIAEVARLTGIDPEDLGVSTTSRTYFNGQDRRRVRIEDVLGPYMTAIEDRLSMSDVTPRGYTVKFDTSSYLRLDDLAAAQSDAVLIAAKVLIPDEARVKRGLEPRGDNEPAAADQKVSTP